ncbi:hypothetical protein ACLMJK_008191 [Lecanora helva]
MGGGNGPQPTILPATKYTTENCTNISQFCPVEQTIYGYYPNLGANIFFCAFFGICVLVHLYAGLRYKTWTYFIALFWGCVAECLGYVGRIMLNHNPWSDVGFEIQICCLIIAPAFLAAGVYLTLKHSVLEIGAEFSRIQPRYYTWIFILCDLFSLILQGAGGGTAATADNGSSEQDTGNDLMMAGIVWQVFTLLVFGILVGDYALRVRAHKSELKPSALKLLHDRKFQVFVWGLVLAYLTIFTRCVFRIGEMAGGWSNSIMQDETDFIVLDGVMIVIATFCLTAFHPGWMFPPMQMHGKNGPIAEFQTADAEKVVGGTDSPSSLSKPQQERKKGFMGRFSRK